MANELNFFDSYELVAISEEIVPVKTFFKDRYFPTEAGDIFASDKVLAEYQKGDTKMAPFVSDRVGDIPVGREGYRVDEYSPALIAPSRILTMDDLKKRGFGEALYAGTPKAERAAKIMLKDMSDLDGRIVRREEWMCAQTMVNNACTMQTMIDGDTQGETLYVRFYDTTSDHTYTIASGTEWDGANANAYGDIKAMARMLAEKGLPVADLVLGSDAYDALLDDAKVQEMIDKNKAFNDSTVEEAISEYVGVTYAGTLNFGGYKLNVICVDETYVDDNGDAQKYFPSKSAMVTAPGCGHLMYGQITQIDFGSSEYTDYASARVPKIVVDQPNDMRKTILKARPLAAPKNYCPYIYAADVVS